MSDQRNVVLVTVDSLRADHCGFMGYENETTPTLDRLATEGVVFENAIAPGPSTYDSMPAVFTGRHMTPLTGDDAEGDSLDRRTANIARNMHSETLAEWFDRQGYATGAFTTNPYTGEHTAFARGFDRFEDFMGDGEGPLMQQAAHLPVLSELKHLVTLLRGDRASMRWSDYYTEILDWVQSVSEPYFLWVFLLDTHTPYLADAQFRSETSQLEMYYHNWKLWLAKKWLDADGRSLDRETLLSLYDDTIRSVDTFIGRLLDDLAATDPAVVVHADHGEAFGEHGTYGHQETLYEENVRVPLLVHEGDDSAGDTVSTPVSLTELPTVLQSIATGAPVTDGIPDSGTVVCSKNWRGNRIALRTAAWKYIASFDPATHERTGEELYYLPTDAGERDNVVSEADAVTTACRRLVRGCRCHDGERRRLSTVADGFVDAGGPAEGRP